MLNGSHQLPASSHLPRRHEIAPNLTPEHVEDIQILENGYKNGWIDAQSEAEEHEPFDWEAFRLNLP